MVYYLRVGDCEGSSGNNIIVVVGAIDVDIVILSSNFDVFSSQFLSSLYI